MIADGADEVCRREGGDEIVRRTLALQAAIKRNVVVVPDDENLGGLTAMGREQRELGHQLIGALAGLHLDRDDIGNSAQLLDGANETGHAVLSEEAGDARHAGVADRGGQDGADRRCRVSGHQREPRQRADARLGRGRGGVDRDQHQRPPASCTEIASAV